VKTDSKAKNLMSSYWQMAYFDWWNPIHSSWQA